MLLCLPLTVLAQEYKPSDFSGFMRLEDNKGIDFTSLNNPTDGTSIAYYVQKPSQDQYRVKKERKLLPFSKISMIKILPVTKDEAAELRRICGDGTLLKATLTLNITDKEIPDVVYLDFKWFEWSSDKMKGFSGTYRMEVRFLDEIEIQMTR
jgi:hypothetical protein